MIVATPFTIFPEKRTTASGVAIVTLCGIAASAFENAISKATPAGTPSEFGEKAKSLASIALTTDVAVGRGVGRGVGTSVGRGVGRGVRMGVGRGVEIEVGVALSVGLEVPVGSVVAVCAGLAGAPGMALMPGVSPGSSEVIGDESNPLGAMLPGLVVGACGPIGGAPPQPATSRTTASRLGSRGGGTAAL